MVGVLAVMDCDDGTEVQAGDPICQIECFKIFTHVEAPVAGKVQFRFKLGEMVGQDDVIAYIVTE